MKQIIEWWPFIASIAALTTILIEMVRQYRLMDKIAQDEAKAAAGDRLRLAVSSWLLKAVTDAESEMGSGTGRLKIRRVYERAIEVFGPGLAQVITLEQLDALAQAPLAEMRKLLESNSGVAGYVNREVV